MSSERHRPAPSPKLLHWAPICRGGIPAVYFAHRTNHQPGTPASFQAVGRSTVPSSAEPLVRADWRLNALAQALPIAS
ncbi:hypothetical protein OPT61_g214 [Boeremia exigua]|uniref:Uncharacterized protein n=1 Tax=Boeremia exigua TaxID=749465 RepID=A0ACC2IUJ0_9PLEO|nr:hypothetical protein OPT61_g214 [Boeremia exigua]